MKKSISLLSAAVLLSLTPPTAGAQSANIVNGSEVPYWASLTVDEANMRVGPGEDYRILWVYKRKQLPLKVIRVIGTWRQVEDPDGAQGWILSRFLSRTRTALVRGGEAALKENADGSGRTRWRLEEGVTGRLGDCAAGWCAFDVRGRSGYVDANLLWGDEPPARPATNRPR